MSYNHTPRAIKSGHLFHVSMHGRWAAELLLVVCYCKGGNNVRCHMIVVIACR